jgi:tRNA U34 5-methylaminomethyl-2-thiouridine-forming methyltransferase MnmC
LPSCQPFSFLLNGVLINFCFLLQKENKKRRKLESAKWRLDIKSFKYSPERKKDMKNMEKQVSDVEAGMERLHSIF